MLTGGSRSFVWDYDNRVTGVTTSGSTTSMSYDYTGMRTEKSGSLGTTIFPFSGYEIGPGGISVKYIRIGIENVASKKSTGEKFFYHNDHLGGVNVITNTSGVLAQLVEYDPWGKVSRSEGGGDSLRRFTGQQLDPESGLYYYGGRYYDPDLGRFISPDPFVQDPGDPQALNRYSYVRNNPVNLIDPSGYSFFSKLFKKIKKFFKAVFKNPAKLFASIVVGVVTGFIAGPAGLGFSASAAGAFAGAAAGATFAGLTGGNPLLGALSGGIFGGLTGGILGAPVPGADFPAGLSTPALVQAAGGGAGFGDFFAGRRVSAGDDLIQSPNPLLMLASHRSVQFGCMNPVARCEPLPPSNPQTQPPKPVLPDRKALDVDLCKQCRPPVVDRIPEICVSQGNLCIRGEPAGIPPAERPLTAPEILRRGLQRQLEGP